MVATETDGEGEGAGAVSASRSAEPVVILPRKPLVLIPEAAAGAACEGDSCAF
ncbi:hypothetical protein VD659_18785 [Herbiconiux sp. 11R-BC]|uniref:hypothetical protein n=1 Tax=Herbiconiux sp. 11R-BC TaxID=3111637 RepID=UPI003C065875